MHISAGEAMETNWTFPSCASSTGDVDLDPGQRLTQLPDETLDDRGEERLIDFAGDPAGEIVVAGAGETEIDDRQHLFDRDGQHGARPASGDSEKVKK